MSPEWRNVIANFEARQLLVSRLSQVEERGYWRLIGALAFLWRSEGRA